MVLGDLFSVQLVVLALLLREDDVGEDLARNILEAINYAKSLIISSYIYMFDRFLTSLEIATFLFVLLFGYSVSFYTVTSYYFNSGVLN